MTKAISFLGLNARGYSETTYVDPRTGARCRTEFFQEALVQFFKPDALYVLLTSTAETGVPQGASRSTWAALQDRLTGQVELRPVRGVPEGAAAGDVWRLFDLLTGCLEAGDGVIFDITHGFRSLPVLSLVAVSYLRVARNVQIEGLVYGAFDARDPATGEAPVFDLLPILCLLDWTTATDQFLRTGNAQALAGLLPEEDPGTQALRESLAGIASGLHLLRPRDVMREAAALPERIAAAAPYLCQHVPAFGALLQRVQEDYGAFGLADPAAEPRERLRREREMIEWYAEKGQTVHALSLAREWLPSLLCAHFEVDAQDEAERADMELLLRGGIDKAPDGTVSRRSKRLDEWSGVPEGKRLRSLWGGAVNLAQVRNDVLHAGFRRKPRSAAAVEAQTKQILDEIRAIAEAWGLGEKA